jgi:autotransporter-associated beta strand protein
VIESLDPISLPLWLVALYAAAMYPLGMLFGSQCVTCCCAKCDGCFCCGDEYPRFTGECCDGQWRLDEGTCCGDDWYEEEGECCGKDFHAPEDEGECCNNQWQTGEGTCCKAKQIPLDIPECEGCFPRRAKASLVWLSEESGLSVVITDGGDGYATRQPQRIAPTLTVGGGSGAGLEVNLTLEEIADECGRPAWRIESLTFSGGTGYRYTPAVPGGWVKGPPPNAGGGGGGGGAEANPTSGYLPPRPAQDQEALAVTCAVGEATLVAASLVVTSNSSGEPTAVTIANPGSYYGQGEEDETYVFTPDVVIPAGFVVGGLGGAALTATVDGDHESPTFGQVTEITVDEEGTTYEGWQWPLLDYWYTDEGTCCGTVWHTDEGKCCNNAWYPDGEECPAGQVFIEKSATCCGCMVDEIYDPVTEEMVPTLQNLNLVNCPACDLDSFPYSPFDEFGNDRGPIGRCCAPGGSCTYTFEEDCEGEWEEKCCPDEPRCVGPCCHENDDGVASCEMVPADECQHPDLLGGQPDCESSCKGACCIDGAPIIEGGQITMMTQAECDEAEGCWAGVGRESCRETGECRPPFTTACCESVVSEASGLTFTQPRRKRCEPTTRPWLATVTGTTDSEIMIHGVRVGQTATPTKRCPFGITFLICWDSFNIEPLACETSFRRLDVTVCWIPAEANSAYLESLNFSGCDDITLWLGDCTRSCETTLTYAGPGVTVGATVEIRGDATLEANGGALVFPAFTYAAACDITLTLAGTSTAANAVPAMANPASGFTKSIKKTGAGRWKLTAASTFTGSTEILAGTLIVATNAPLDGNGAFGYSLNGGLGGGSSPIVEMAGGASLLLDSGAQVGRIIDISGGSGQATLGGANTSGTTRFQSAMTFFVNHDVLIQAAGGGTVEFANGWLGGAYGNAVSVENDFTFGSEGNTGTVLLSGNLSTTGAARVEKGTLRVSGSIAADAGVTITGSGTELDYRGTVALASPVSLAQGTLTGEGTISDVTVSGSPTIRVDTGDEIEIDDELSGSGTLAKTGAGTLRLAASTFSGTLNISAGEVVLEQIKTNPGGLVSTATFSNTALTVAFTGDPETDDEFVLLSGPTTQSYTPTLTGTTKTGTYNASTSTLTID